VIFPTFLRYTTNFKGTLALVPISTHPTVQRELTWVKSGINGSIADPDDFGPDPDPTFENVRILTYINFRTNFFRNFVWPKYALKSIFMNQKVKQQVILKFLWHLHTPKKLI
jgi:hypothetical protein